MPPYKIDGYVAEGFERVRIQFEKNFIDGIDRCAQVCVYVGEDKVVDLWGSVIGSKEYDGDTISNVFSSTKPLAAICMAILVDKNLLNYQDKVIKHWPEYGNGDKDKESITIEDILKHEGGMATFSKILKPDDLLRENVKKNSIGRIIEIEPLRFPPSNTNTKTEYHTFTRGWILNEIFRRIDPQQRTIGECLRDDICIPLNTDCYIGLESEQLTKPRDLSFLSVGNVLLSSLVPKAFGRKIAANASDMLKTVQMAKSSPTLKFMELMPNSIDGMIRHFDTSPVRMGEIPSANGHCSARGLAKIAAMIANGGTIDGNVILSKDTCDKFHSKYEDTKILYPFGYHVNYSQGGVNFYMIDESLSSTNGRSCNRNRAGYIGWYGLGGSVFQWHLEYKIGFAYVPSFLAWEDIYNHRGSLLQKIVLDCVKDMQNEKTNHN